MGSNDIVKLQNKITEVLLDGNWLKNNGVPLSFIKTHIRDRYFVDSLKDMVDKKDFSCRAVLILCKRAMEEFALEKPPQDWLSYIFNYTLYKSFPNAAAIDNNKELNAACQFYLDVLRVVINFQRTYQSDYWQWKYPLDFLTQAEEKSLENSNEYRNFLNSFSREYIFEMMILSKEVKGHNTLDHICGVHYLALFIGRQLKLAGLPVDLGRVSGAAAGHDIGKYGCRGNEMKRVPYLHYYYTDLWFKKHNITYIGHIAVNHSTWDLELENLSLESLILIYSDFRVKNYTDVNNQTSMHIYSLDQSFDVILEKLDNVDNIKLKRYQRVYYKLKDFEEYVLSLGIKVDIGNEAAFSLEHLGNKSSNYSLMQGKEVIDNLKFLAINHNIHLMHQLRDESSLNSILEQARGEKDSESLRDYLNIIQEYSTYLTQKQKLITIKFLYELLTHNEDDIRKHCAQLIGSLIAFFDEDYRKEVPENIGIEPPDVTSNALLDKYIHSFIWPDHKIIQTHRTWIGYNLSNMIDSLFSHCKREQIYNYFSIILTYYQRDDCKEGIEDLYLLEAAKHIPIIDDCNHLEVLYNYILCVLDSSNKVLRLSALEVALSIISKSSLECSFIDKLRDRFNSPQVSKFSAENFVALKIARALGLRNEVVDTYQDFCNSDLQRVSEMFLSNLKTATNWIVKKVQIDSLLEYALVNSESIRLHTALHLCNLLKVSAYESVRNKAGEAVIKLMPHLTIEQRNEVAIEVLRALEIEDYQFAEYMPNYLGRLILHLQPIELDEILEDLIYKIKHSNSKISSLLLRTLGITISNYQQYRDNFQEEEASYNNRLTKMIGVILNGLVHYNLRVKKVAFSVIGKQIFASKNLNLQQKNNIFQGIAKKILTLMADKRQDQALVVLSISSGLNHIYRFISDYIFYYGSIAITIPEKVAFFPGTFDPFSLSHKEIAKEIRNLGFEVYLAVDEFSWSKQTLPNLLRRNIISMSIADELSIYLYPLDHPVNLANPIDLGTLRSNFPRAEVYIVVGSDVILNASSYRMEKKVNSIHTFNHIIFDRRSSSNSYNSSTSIELAEAKIEGRIINLNLPSQYEDISSTQIRNNIDVNRDISKLVDPLAQKYIYENSFYRREPQYKTLMEPISIDIEVVESLSKDLLEQLTSFFGTKGDSIRASLLGFANKPSARFIVLRDTSQGGKVLGFSAHHWVRLNSLYQELQNNKITDYIRESSAGRILFIDGIFVDKSSKIENLEQIMLTETLAFCISKDYEYGIYKNLISDYSSASLHELLILHGFYKLLLGNESSPVFVVNMSSPCTLNLDTHTVMKEPFKSNKNILTSIKSARKKLQKSLTDLYPGNLVLSFDTNLLYQKLIKKVCQENGMPNTPLNPRTLGNAMCVPFGNILNRYVVPNTVTKALHIEKMFEPDMKSYSMGPYPFYLDLENQIKMLKSFNRPIILVDDILNKGYRFGAINPLLDKEGIKVQKIILGILSARGKELAYINNREVDCIYFIPKLRLWFSENLLYPFAGGDTLWRGDFPQRNLSPSINLILPYMSPTFIKGSTRNAIYKLSETCIENGIQIFSSIEDEYQEFNERNLTLGSLGEVFIYPRCPDHGKNMYYDLNLPPSHYLKNDLENLKRIEHVLLNI